MVNLFEKSNFDLSLKDDFVFRYYSGIIQPFGVKEHFHDVYEMLLFIRGDCEYAVEGNRYVMNPMDLIFTNTRELHTPIFHSDSHYERINILIKPAFLSAFVTESYSPLALFENRPLGRQNKVDGKTVKDFGIDTWFIRIKDALAADNQYSGALVKALLIQMLVQIELALKAYPMENTLKPSESGYVSNDKISAALRYISANLDKELDYDALAGMLFVSKSYLYRLFKQHTGFTLTEYVKYKRIGKAKELLLEGMGSMIVAQQLGFKDYTNFFRAFKSVAGVAPSEFIR